MPTTTTIIIIATNTNEDVRGFCDVRLRGMIYAPRET